MRRSRSGSCNDAGPLPISSRALVRRVSDIGHITEEVASGTESACNSRAKTRRGAELRSKNDNKQLQGLHVKVYPSGDRYEGFFERGQRSGRGQYLWASGDRYEGQWVAGRMHGSGTFFWATGDVHSGEWQNGRADGLGVKVTLDGEKTEGSFEDGLAEGWARRTYSFGDTYEGLLRRSRRQGYGAYLWRSGDRYCGLWAADRMTGPGTFDKHFTVNEQLALTEVVHYSGEYLNGKFGGYGTARFADGEEYSGDWAEGLRHGWGRSTWCSQGDPGAGWESIFRPLHEVSRNMQAASRVAVSVREQLNDSIVSALEEHACIVHETYEGAFSCGFREGAGCFYRVVLTLDRGSGHVVSEAEAYEGHWRAGQKHGWGTIHYPNGSVYRGDVCHGRRHGRGELFCWPAQHHEVGAPEHSPPVSSSSSSLAFAPLILALSGEWVDDELVAPRPF